MDGVGLGIGRNFGGGRVYGFEGTEGGRSHGGKVVEFESAICGACN